MTTEQELKELKAAVSTSRERLNQLIKSADNIARDDALRAICGNPADRPNSEASAKRYNKRADDLREAVNLLP